MNDWATRWVKDAGTRWVTAEVLRALASMAKAPAVVNTFNPDALEIATADTLSPLQRANALAKLVALGFLQRESGAIGGLAMKFYKVTPEGRAAIEAAAAGHVRKSGPKGTRKPNPVRTDALATRLWALMRVRKMLDSETAARTLCDAGDERFESVRATVSRTLRRWELAGALVASARRVALPGQPKQSNGNKRYVLVRDSGPTPPRWRKAEGAQAVNEGGGA